MTLPALVCIGLPNPSRHLEVTSCSREDSRLAACTERTGKGEGYCGKEGGSRNSDTRISMTSYTVNT